MTRTLAPLALVLLSSAVDVPAGMADDALPVRVAEVEVGTRLKGLPRPERIWCLAGARGPKFRLLFGEAADTPHVPPPAPERLFGYAVHQLLRARFCLERGRVWQAEYWLSEARDLALGLACRRRGLSAHHGRGIDDLPEDVHAAFGDALAGSFDSTELHRALGVVVEGLLREADDVRELATRVEPELCKLVAPADAG